MAAALIVLLSTGVAISRMSEGDKEDSLAAGSTSTSSTVPGLGGPGPATNSGTATEGDTGSVAEQATASGGAGSEGSAAGRGLNRPARTASGDASTSGSSAAAADESAATGAGSTGGPGTGAPSGGSPGGGGQEPPPSPSQVPPEETPLATAHVSAGEGAQGAVVGADLGDGQPAELDVTIGTNQLVGDAPPAEGTGVDLGGRVLSSPSAALT